MEAKDSIIKLSSNNNGEKLDIMVNGDAVSLMALMCLAYDRVPNLKELVEGSIAFYNQHNEEVKKTLDDFN